MRKKNSNLLVRLAFGIFVLGLLALAFYWFKSQPKEIVEDGAMEVVAPIPADELDELTNISELPEEFMENYLAAATEAAQSTDVENTLIVTSTKKLENAFGARQIVEGPNNQYFLYFDSPDKKASAMDELSGAEGVLYVEEDDVFELAEYNSWGVEAMGMDQALDSYDAENAEPVTVAIIDTGCKMQLFNQNFPGKIEETYNLYNQFENEDMEDNHGHGTHIAGTIAESTPDNVKILPVKVSDDEKIRSSDIITAINYINYYHKADVINMSFSATGVEKSIYAAIAAAEKNNIISVAAAGNDGDSVKNYPAAFDNTISVSAIDSNREIASFSSYGSTVTFAAPGAAIKSINGIKSGTSMATPHVVSAVAFLKGNNKDLTLDQTIAILKSSAIDLGAAGRDDYYGYGLIDLSQYANLQAMTEETDIVDFEVIQAWVMARFGNITNLMNMKVRLVDAAGNYHEKYLGELEDLEIIGYDAFAVGDQVIQISYNGISKNVTVNNGEDGGDISAYTLSGKVSGGAILTKVSSPSAPKKLYIPEYIDGYRIMTIGDYSDPGLIESNSAMKVEHVVLPPSVSSIDDRAFYNETELRTVTGGAEYVAVGEEAFYGAYKLTTFEPKISLVAPSAFRDAKSLKSVVLSDNLTAISARAFQDCEHLENINIPSKLTKIGDYALMGTSLKNLNIPKDLTTIGSYAFYDMLALETITVDPENTVYDSRDNSNALIDTAYNAIILGSEGTVIPDSVTRIRAGAFRGNQKIREIDMNNVMSVGEGIFRGCTNLNRVYVNEDNALSNMVNLKAFYNAADSKYGGLPNVVLFTRTNSGAEGGSYYVNGFSNQQVRAYVKIKTPTIEVSGVTPYYTAFQQVGSIGVIALHDGYAEAPYEGYLEEAIENYTIEYQHGDSFRSGDTGFILRGTTQYGEEFEKFIDVIVEKIVPTYTVPTGLTAKVGQKLSEVVLPEHFEWMDGDQTMVEAGEVSYKARYVPVDTENYEIVENIDITVTVEQKEEEFTYRINDYDVDETNKYIKKIIVNTDKDEFTSHITLGSGYGVNVNTKAVDNKQLLYTGGKTKITKDSSVYSEYTNVVVGDVNGDGAINSADLLKIRQHLLSINILTGVYFLSSDINYDSTINSADLLRVRQHLLGTKPIN